LVNCLRDKPMTQLSIHWILSLNRLSQKWGQVQDVPEEELDLLQFAATPVVKLSAGPAKIMGSQMIQFHAFGTPPNHVPNDIF
jgi:hypothetical protein